VKVALIYIFPQVAAHTYEPLARRFTQTYLANPPGVEPHDLHVISNGGDITEHQRKLFDPLPVTHHTHNNVGKDVGAFQMAAETIPCDLMLCLGSHVHFWRAGWLDQIVGVFLDNGPGLYGCWAFHQPADHIRTTAFWLPPEVLRSYPSWIGDHQRYAFEHDRQNSITAWCRKVGFPTLQVTWNRVLDYDHWDHVIRNETLLLDQHCDHQGWG
jgi:hypothetical protein